jgi:hypothetical protein
MALSAKNRAEIVDLIGYEADFERSGISGRIVRDATACPRQGELTKAEYADLMDAISHNDVRYVVFSYFTPIAWVHRSHDGVTMMTRTFSATTSQHQKMIVEAFGKGLVNTGKHAPQGEAPVVLSENEEIILRRMRDEDGTECAILFSSNAIADKPYKFAPRDQVGGLEIKGLVSYVHPEHNDDRPAVGVQLTDKGRKHLDKIQSVKEPEAPKTSQYVELTEDELIELASDLGDRVYASGTAGEGRRASLELVAVVGALKARREATAPARRRIGEYLRQQGIVEAQYEKDISSDSNYAKRNAKPVQDILDELRADKYAKKAMLRLTDLRKLVTPLVRDTKAEFEAEQQRRLELWQAKGLPEKQAVLLECISKGHMTVSTHTGRSYSGGSKGMWHEERCQKCQRPDGRTLEALRRKDVFGTIPPLGYTTGGRMETLMLKDPEKSDK